MSITTVPNSPTTSTSAATEAATVRRPLWRVALGSSVVAAAVNFGIAAIARAGDVALRVDDSGKRIPPLGFAQVTLVCGLLGLAIAALCRRSAAPRQRFVVVTLALTVVSCVPPLLVDATLSTRLVLELTHVVAAAIIIGALARRLDRR